MNFFRECALGSKDFFLESQCASFCIKMEVYPTFSDCNNFFSMLKNQIFELLNFLFNRGAKLFYITGMKSNSTLNSAVWEKVFGFLGNEDPSFIVSGIGSCIDQSPSSLVNKIKKMRFPVREQAFLIKMSMSIKVGNHIL